MSTLTDDEKTILTNALPIGDIYMMRTDRTGDFVVLAASTSTTRAIRRCKLVASTH